MLRRMRTLDEILTVGFELRIGNTEVVMNGCTFKDSLLNATSFPQFVIPNLKNNAEAFNKKYPAKNRQQQLFMYDNCGYTNDTANG